MSIRALKAFIVLAALATFAWSTTASAGIIVTVGKFASQLGSGDDGPGGDAKPSHLKGDKHLKLPVAPMPDPDPGAEVEETDDDWGDFEEVPDGFSCSNIGGGIVYCDRDDDAGAGPGAGEGGVLDDGAELDDDEIAVMGCQSGGASGPFLAALLLLIGFAWRRRQLV